LVFILRAVSVHYCSKLSKQNLVFLVLLLQVPVLHAFSLLSSNGTLSVEIVLVLEPNLDGQISILVVFVVITFIEAVVDFVLSEFNIVLEVCEADILSNV